MGKYKVGDRVIATKASKKGKKGRVASLSDLEKNDGSTIKCMSVTFKDGSQCHGPIRAIEMVYGIENLETPPDDETKDWADAWEKGSV